MIAKTYFEKICARKPDLFGALPEAVLSRALIDELRGIPRVAVGEIPGHGSFDTLCETLSLHKPDAFVPTIAYTGTEYGSWDVLYRACRALKKRIQRTLNIYCVDPVMVGSPAFWRALNGSLMHALRERFRCCCICPGCRLYACALRIPLCRTLETHIFISDSGGQYAGCRLSGEAEIVKYSRIFMAGFGIELVDATSVAGRTIKEAGANRNRTVSTTNIDCVFAPCHAYGENPQAPRNLKKYFESYAIPAAARIISRTLAEKEVDYEREIKDFF